MTLSHLRSMPNLRKARIPTPVPPVPPVDPEINVVTLPLGDGTEINPYIIRYFGNLRWVSENSDSWDKYLLQVRSIDAVYSEQLDGGAGFTPIGDASAKFTGHYNGAEYSTSNLYINRPSEEYIGLFGYCYGADLDNVILEDCNIIGLNYVGGLAGRTANYTKIDNCSTSGSITATYTGDNFSGVGGLIGVSNNTTINKCFSKCDVSGYRSVGGLIGYESTTTVNDSYSIGSISGYSQVGGFTGYVSSDSSVNKCYCVGVVTGTHSSHIYEGGFAGYTNGTPCVNCYYDSTISGRTDTNAGSIPKTTAQMKEFSTFTGWDFATIWTLNPLLNSGYPYLGGGQEYSEVEGDILDVAPEGGVGELEYYEVEGDILDVESAGGIGELEYYEVEGDILDVAPESLVEIV